MLRVFSLRTTMLGILFTVALAVPLFVFGACGTPDPEDPYSVKNMAECTGLSTSGTLPGVIGNMIKGILALTGVIFFGLFFYGGFKWMTARGDEENVKEAKGTIESASIGLVIIIISYALATYVITQFFS